MVRSATFGGVLFDLDGTLVDSLSDIAESVNHVLAELGHPQHPREHIRALVGEGARQLLKRALPPGTNGKDVDEALRRYQARYGDRLVVRTRPYDGILPLVSELGARGVRLGVVTNKPHQAACTLVEALFPGAPFSVVLGESAERPRKPDPAPALEAARILDVPAAACAFVGDTSVDLRTAQAAGMTAVGVTWGFRPRSELEEHGADHIVETVAALGALLTSG